METVKIIPLTDTNQKIFDRYAELAYDWYDVHVCTPEDFETIATLPFEMRGIGFVVD